MRVNSIALLMCLSAGFALGHLLAANAAPAPVASIAVVDTEPLSLRGHADGSWSQVVFQSDSYGGKRRVLVATCTKPDGTARSSDENVTGNTGRAFFPFATGEVWT